MSKLAKLIVVVLVLALLVGAFFYARTFGLGIKGFTDPSGAYHPPKTLWDLLELLLVPLFLSAIAIIFNTLQRGRDLSIATNQARESAWQNYVHDMMRQLDDFNANKIPEDLLCLNTRLLTLTTLRNLDAVRKGHLVKFLYEAGLIGGKDFYNKRRMPIVDLQDADLVGVSLPGANLEYSHLDGANMQKANLRDANLTSTSLIKTNLKRADLTRAKVHFSRLSEANLDNACCTGVNFARSEFYSLEQPGFNIHAASIKSSNMREANLIYAKVLPQQLAMVKSLVGATMPDGEKFNGYHHFFSRITFVGAGTMMNRHRDGVEVVCTCGQSIATFDGNEKIPDDLAERTWWANPEHYPLPKNVFFVILRRVFIPHSLKTKIKNETPYDQ